MQSPAGGRTAEHLSFVTDSIKGGDTDIYAANNANRANGTEYLAAAGVNWLRQDKRSAATDIVESDPAKWNTRITGVWGRADGEATVMEDSTSFASYAPAGGT